jgi:hypothetical protein
LDVGQKQGRYAECGDHDLTSIEAEAIVLQYPELQRLFNYNPKSTLATGPCVDCVRSHLGKGDNKDKFKLSRPEDEQPFYIGGVGSKLDKCDGSVWIGYSQSPIDNSTLTSWGDFRMFTHERSVLNNNTQDHCELGSRFPGWDKNSTNSTSSLGCWCEQAVKYKPFKCANEGE